MECMFSVPSERDVVRGLSLFAAMGGKLTTQFLYFSFSLHPLLFILTFCLLSLAVLPLEVLLLLVLLS